ncbi:peptide ABC transporter permease [Thioclava sp. SK-1]|uniref:dipeptide/oligopeptide/nickel ABC transporter permease/ATP-binding protein n=1 Tax=Thioclava sp. SK-1 TaxID=1889770 RepID=UPI0008250545|nr:dipeptide/oligopeptide/nickel ABC transporter permease/ATP-binding protein [Thioclava sp. SK-1]OCX58179.1 peptide ABC transporter permease [Thioclava sp. SK-1]
MRHSKTQLYFWLGLAALLVLIVLAAPLLPLGDVRAMDIPHRFAGPSAAHWLGLDHYGRDVLSRIIWGARASLAVAFGSAFAAAIIGTILGLIGGYFRGIAEIFTVRATEIILFLPPLLLALLVITILGAGVGTLILAITILYVPNYTRVVYAATLQTASLDFVTAQRAMGTHPATILARTILPNIVPPLLVQFSLTVAAAILLESGLSFLGLGVVPPAPSWGLMIRAARGALDAAPLLLLWPSLALAGTVLLLNIICDKLQDVLNPRSAAVGGAAWLRGLRNRGPEIDIPTEAPTTDPQAGPALLQVEGLSVALAHPTHPRVLTRNISLQVAPGETLALVGESGSGKTLTGLAMTGLLPNALYTAGGSAKLRTRAGAVVDLTALDEDALRSLRGHEISMVFQDASAALSPVHRVGDQLAEIITSHRSDLSAAQITAQVTDLLRKVGIPDPARRARAYPFELSGGQRQRAMIAMAVANKPRLLIADEPTTALDPTIQAQILTLLADLKAENPEMGVIFVTHNLAVVHEIADRVCVMYAGEVVEQGTVEQVFAHPAHPYTKALLASVPESDAARLESIPGTVPQPANMPEGCRFAPRCTYAQPGCNATQLLQPVAVGRTSRCLRWKEILCPSP